MIRYSVLTANFQCSQHRGSILFRSDRSSATVPYSVDSNHWTWACADSSVSEPVPFVSITVENTFNEEARFHIICNRSTSIHRLHSTRIETTASKCPLPIQALQQWNIILAVAVLSLSKADYLSSTTLSTPLNNTSPPSLM